MHVDWWRVGVNRYHIIRETTLIGAPFWDRKTCVQTAPYRFHHYCASIWLRPRVIHDASRIDDSHNPANAQPSDLGLPVTSAK